MNKHKGFVGVFILIGILIIGLGIAGAWYFKLIQIPGFAPPGCSYQKVQCVMAPCDPILVCGIPYPKSLPTSIPSPTVGTVTDKNACESDQDCQNGEICDISIFCSLPDPTNGQTSCSQKGARVCLRKCQTNDDCSGIAICKDYYRSEGGDAIYTYKVCQN